MIKTKNITTIVAIILLVFMILRFCLVIIHMEHDCSHDDNCPICALIHKYKNDLNGINFGLTKIVITIFLLLSSLTLNLLNRVINKKKYTPVGLKVELIN